MSFMLEIYYRAPSDSAREQRVSAEAARFGGNLTYTEEPENNMSSAICLTYEFVEMVAAEQCAQLLRTLGEYVEGPVDYGGSEQRGQDGTASDFNC